MRQLKRVNEELFSQVEGLRVRRSGKNRERVFSIESRGHITDRARAFSLKKSESTKMVDENRAIHEIVKTEFIEGQSRNQPSYNPKTQQKRVKPISSSFKTPEEPSSLKIHENSKTFQIIESKTERELLLPSKKKQALHNHPYLKMNRRQQEEQLKSCYLLTASPDR